VDPSHALWIGGGHGSGKSAVAQALSERFELQLYSVDERSEAHAARMPGAGLGWSSLDEFVTTSRHRFRLVLEDLRALPDAPVAIVEGIELLPTSVSAVLGAPGRALFLTPVSDDAVSARIAREARELRLTSLPAGRPVEELIELAAQHFAGALSVAGDTSP
jgi:2-phosphoglycerate kinase